MMRIILSLFILISVQAEATQMTRRALLRSFGAALVASSGLAGPSASGLLDGFEDSLSTAAMQQPPIPWGLVEHLKQGRNVFVNDEDCFCYTDPRDRLKLLEVSQSLLRRYSNYEGLSEGGRSSIRQAMGSLDRLVSIEHARWKQITDAADRLESYQPASEVSQSDQPKPVIRLIDLISRYLPVDRINRIHWQVAYPDSKVLNEADFVALEELTMAVGEEYNFLPLTHFLNHNSCLLSLQGES